ncbi:rhomboid family intramembrane serine protease [Chitinophaga vietnamensis]|uniref:rhomboid family intramembrane serine protease n=1 Tax=Chitinophaga vietnamensis TaxID=2593957 RepID=UPI001177E79E|nr:rhomboid family intramembrane serine protease [Chitinophaga vietnamensis]
MNEYRPGRFQFLPLVIKNLLIINGLVWLLEITLLKFGYDLSNLFALHYWGSDLFKPYQFVTHLFMHDPSNILHLAFNMFTLWMFGATLENLWGPKRFLVFYMVCGVGAALCHMGVLTYENIHLTRDAHAFYTDPSFSNFVVLDNRYHLSEMFNLEGLKAGLSENPPNEKAIEIAKLAVHEFISKYRNGATLGASGAVYGILFAFGYLFANTYIYLYFMIPVKAKYFVGFLIVMELWAGLQNSAGDNVAHFAHLGGALFAYLLLKKWSRNRTNFY